MHYISSTVKLLTQRRDPNTPPDTYTKSLGLLQLIIRQAPNTTHGFPADARSFYYHRTAQDVGIGLSVWQGYFQ